MKLTGNTIFITGGGSGIGRALAEAFQKLGNTVIISGRRKAHLAETIRANPGMESLELDVTDPASIAKAAAELSTKHPKLNILVNNAGIMRIDDISSPIDDAAAVAIVTTNLLGPIRMTSALIEQLKKQESATVINVSSGLGFVPMAMAAVYSSTKAAVHSYTLSLRHKLRRTPVKVLEIAPPWVQTDLLNSKEEPRAMKLDEFIQETMQILGGDATEIIVERAQGFRDNPGPNEHAFVTQFNEMMESPE